MSIAAMLTSKNQQRFASTIPGNKTYRAKPTTNTSRRVARGGQWGQSPPQFRK